MFLGEKRISLFWIMHGQTRVSTSLQLLPGPGSGNPRSSTIGSYGWLPHIIVLRSLFLAGRSTGRAQAEALRPPTNFLTLRWVGLEIQIHGLEHRGRRARGSRNSWHNVGPCWFLTAWSRSKIRLVHKKDGYGSLPYRRFCANSLRLIRGLA